MKKLRPEDFQVSCVLSRRIVLDLEEKPERNYSDYSFCREKPHPGKSYPEDLNPVKMFPFELSRLPRSFQ